MYVEMKHINKTFDGFLASDNVSFGVEKGHLAALLGPSGSGKTTILRMIAGLDKPDSGDILINGVLVNHLPGSKRGIGFVFQNYALFRYMTVEEDIAFGLEVQKRHKTEIRNRVKSSWSWSLWKSWEDDIPISYLEDRGSGWLLHGLWRRIHNCFCWMNHLRRLTQRCAESFVHGLRR